MGLSESNWIEICLAFLGTVLIPLFMYTRDSRKKADSAALESAAAFGTMGTANNFGDILSAYPTASNTILMKIGTATSPQTSQVFSTDVTYSYAFITMGAGAAN
jgi:hypothetical protein